MVYTKDEFKRLWEADLNGTAVFGITNDDVIECAKAWGLYSNPRCEKRGDVIYRVCEAAGVRKEDMPYNPFGAEDCAQRQMKMGEEIKVSPCCAICDNFYYKEQCPLYNVYDASRNYGDNTFDETAKYKVCCPSFALNKKF